VESRRRKLGLLETNTGWKTGSHICDYVLPLKNDSGEIDISAELAV